MACTWLRRPADPVSMGFFGDLWKVGDQVATLTATEQAEFVRLDQAVGMAVQASKVVAAGGAALTRIKDGQLYRDVAGSWDAYCESRGISANRANQIIRAFQTQTNISSKSGTAVPILSERALRPLVALTESDAIEVIAEASATAGGISPNSIRIAAARRKAKASKLPRPIRLKIPGWNVVLTPNRAAAATGFDTIVALEKAIEFVRRRRAG